MVSRVIVKNLPKKTKESQFRNMFSECGEVTDCKLMMSDKGTFRRFGFIGYASDQQAESAVKRFHNTFIKATKIQVELAKPYGDESIARPWSKYSKGSSAYSRLQTAQSEKDEEGSKRKKTGAKEAKKKGEDRVNENVHSSRLVKLLKEAYEMEGDSNFQEFLAAHKNKSTVRMWSNDDRAAVGSGSVQPTAGVKVSAKVESVPSRKPGGEGVYYTRTHIKFDDGDDASCNTGIGREGGGDSVVAPSQQPISDMEYLQSKMVDRKDAASEEEERDTVVLGQEDSCSDSEPTGSDVGGACEEHHSKVGGEQSEEHTRSHTVKMLGLPFSVRPNDIHEFFHPLKVLDIRWTKDKKGRPSGRAYVDFASERDVVEALRHDGDYIKDRYIELFRDEGPSSEVKTQCDPKPEPQLKPWEVKLLQQEGCEKEDVSDSGRLFIRNLAYTCTEEDLTSLFGKFGPLTEVSLPLDSESNKVIGYAFVTFMFPEHAVKAYQDCDGTIYQGRLLHVLPAKPRDMGEGSGGDAEVGSFKKKKEKQLKSQASSSHTWNALFLGQNAVADSMADRYGTQKGHILNAEGSQSVAVRMALGETQIVSEMKEFLEDQGVNLDVFGKPDIARNKTVILVKNLPFGTTDKDLMVLFSPFGSFVRVVLPPGGISALVEFTEASHAKAAFTKLAYSKFKHLPLYLEWAPVGALGGRRRKNGSREPPGEMKEDAEHQEDDKMEVKTDRVSDNSTLFVKNLNFATSEDTLREHFAVVGPVYSVSIARKRNMKDPSKALSMGFGFVSFGSTALAQDCIKRLQGSELEGHRLELKMSHRESAPATQERSKKSAKPSKQTGAKILVRNLPFEATKREVEELFKTFGEMKMLRLPKKTGGSRGAHRGFGFVEFATKEDARRAFDALCLSTHLYGRRLVLEWAADDDSVEALRKRTAEHFHGDKPPARRSRQIAKELLFSLESSHSRNSADE